MTPEMEIALLRIMLKEIGDSLEAYAALARENSALPDSATEDESAELYRRCLRAALQLCGRSHILSCVMANRIVDSGPANKIEKLAALITRAHASSHGWVEEEAKKLVLHGGWSPSSKCSKDMN